MNATLKLKLAYDGTAYAGWQIQPGKSTAQEIFEKALHRITGETIRVTASGRTDAGVHALGQVVGFSTESRLSPAVLAAALNAELPRDIAVLEACRVPAGFHPTRDVRRKRYRYTIHDGGARDVFARAYCWHYRSRLDDEAMHRAALPLLGRHDFRSFQSSGADRLSTVRTIFDIFVKRREADRDKIDIEIEANGFLYNMVRAIVGTLVEVGRGAQPQQWPEEVMHAADRKAAGPTAPPQGLFLVRAVYDE